MSLQFVGKPSTKIACSAVFTPEANQFFLQLHRTFSGAREDILSRRIAKQQAIRSGQSLDFPQETASIRTDTSWSVALAPNDLIDRRVEITGPVERKMMINALNSGAQVFMADFEDSCSPVWENVVQGQINCMEAVGRKLSHINSEGKEYKLGEQLSTLVIRPRGWHLREKNVLLDGQAVSASLFDFSYYFFHNARELLALGSGPYFYLPKLESYLEARLWNDIFIRAQKLLGIPQGSIRATVLIETLPAAFEMEEILYELREHAAGLNAGRWDYIFSAIKKFRFDGTVLFPDRHQITMTTPFMRAYSELLVKTCHKRGAHAIGGMSAFIPNRKDSAISERALAKVREDKDREAQDGFDGSWVAHPDLVKVARQSFDSVLGKRPHQKDKLRHDVNVRASDLVDFLIPDASLTEEGFRNNVSLAIIYIESWLRGTGAVAINNLMEDVATAEISRAQLWHWIRYSKRISNGQICTENFYRRVREEEVAKLSAKSMPRLREAIEILDRLVYTPHLEEFLTLPAYEKI